MNFRTLVRICCSDLQARSQDCKFGGGGSFSVWGADILRVRLYCYSLLAMSTISVTEYTNFVVIK